MKPGSVLKLILGVILIGLGTFVAIRPLWAPRTTVSGSRLLDVAFAAVFLLRGIVNVRSALRASRS
ncbi:MAG TPA: hypothetical protein VGQ44_10890 [Gemmatimonadaceae bacterium]|nr:hypothetical protein [Gemmatimonadaceae bacterium]